MNSINTLKELFIFFFLTFLISWTIALLLIFKLLPTMPSVIFLVHGPGIVAILLTYLYNGKKGLRSFFNRYRIMKINWKWYIFLTLSFFCIGFGGKVLWNLISENPWSLSLLPISAIMPIIIFQFLIPGLGEEPGWRGFALMRLQLLLSPLKASLILAILHWAWHLPTFWLGTGIHNVPAWLSFLYILPWTILATWLFNHTRGNIMMAVLFHSCHGVMLSLVGFLPSEQDIPLNPNLLTTLWIGGGYLGPYIMVLLILWSLMILILLGFFGGLGKAPEFEQALKVKTVHS